jgi:hypothetical protein
MPVQSSTQDDLFNLDLIRSYVDKELNPRFVERDWLKRQVEGKLADLACRFVLLTAEPGAGKSAFMAWLANQHPNWCRYFIRRDQRNRLSDVGSYSFLLQIGFQLAATYPDLFKQEQVRIVIEQRIGTAANSEIVGAEIEKMFASPFYKQVIQIQQQVTHSKDTNVTGVRIGGFYATERDLPIENLQFMALFDPARAMLKQVQEAIDYPHQQIVVLVDALDELRYQDSELSLLKWLTNCPELPANLRFVLTCRPDDDLLRAFRGSQQGRIQEISIAEEDPDVEKDLTRYTRFLIETPEVNQALVEMHQDSDAFTHQAITKANGNFGYLGAIGRAVDETIRQNQPDLLREILKLSELPDTLQDLYAFFLSKIKDAVAREKVPVEDAEGEIGFVPVWSVVYKPILGILSVAIEPLTPTQIQKLGLIQAEFDYVTGAIERLRQFLDQVGNCYRLYHSTLPEFFTSPKTKERTDYAYCYVDAVKQNQRIVNFYQTGKKSWAEVNLQKIAEDDYGRKHLAQHLVKADRAEELHTLLSLERDGKPAWFKMKDDEGGIADFLTDLELAWSQADASENIGLQCRYALIKSSINSLTAISQELLIALVNSSDPHWKPSKVLAYARQVLDPNEKVERLAALANALPETEPLQTTIVKLAFDTTFEICDVYNFEKALKILVDHFPNILTEVLDDVLKLKNEELRLLGLSILSDKLTPETLPKALNATVEFADESAYAHALVLFANKLTPDLLVKARNATLQFSNYNARARAFTALSDKFPELLTDALDAVIKISNQHDLTSILTYLSSKLTPDLLDKTIDIICCLDSHNDRAEALLALSNRITPEFLPKILDATFSLPDKSETESNQDEILTTLADRFPEHLPKVLKDIINSEEEYCFISLKALAEKFPTRLSETDKILLDNENLFDIINDDERALNREESVSASQSSKLETTISAVSPDSDWIKPIDQYSSDKLSQVLSTALLIKDDYAYAQISTALAVKLKKLLPKALEAIFSIQNKDERAKCLVGLATLSDELTRDLLLKMLDAIFDIAREDELSCANLLVSLSDKLTHDLLLRVLDKARTFKKKICYAHVLTALVDKLPDLLPEALQITLTTESIFHNFLLISLVDKSPNLLRRALDKPSLIRNSSFRRRLKDLAPKLTPDLLSEFLDIVLDWNKKNSNGIDRQNESAFVLSALADQLTPDLLPKVEEIIRALESSYCRTWVLTALAHKYLELLPKAREMALDFCRTAYIFDSHDSARFLIPLIDKYPDLLPKAVNVTLAIENAELRAQALSGLTNFLIQAPDFRLFLRTLLHSLALRTRAVLLRDLEALTPVFFEFSEKEIDDIYQAIQDVRRWWP